MPTTVLEPEKRISEVHIEGLVRVELCCAVVPLLPITPLVCWHVLDGLELVLFIVFCLAILFRNHLTRPFLLLVRLLRPC